MSPLIQSSITHVMSDRPPQVLNSRRGGRAVPTRLANAGRHVRATGVVSVSVVTLDRPGIHDVQVAQDALKLRPAELVDLGELRGQPKDLRSVVDDGTLGLDLSRPGKPSD